MTGSSEIEFRQTIGLAATGSRIFLRKLRAGPKKECSKKEYFLTFKLQLS